MDYKVKDVQELLGITRKAIILYEKEGLIKASPNIHKKELRDKHTYRTFDASDLEILWRIKVLQGIGFTLKEIKRLFETNIKPSDIREKVKELELQKDKLEKHLGFAKKIELEGHFPEIPKSALDITPHQYLDDGVREWNILKDPLTEATYEALRTALDTDALDEKKLEVLMNSMKYLVEELNQDSDTKAMNLYYQEIARRKHLSYQSDEIQLLVQLIYETYQRTRDENQDGSIDRFKYLTIKGFCNGLIGEGFQSSFGEDTLEYMIQAVEYFAEKNIKKEDEVK